MERERGDEADRMREAAIASSASLRPNFKPENGISDSQLSKFQELHKRRLQIKAKSKVNKNSKGLGYGKGKSYRKAIEAIECTHEESIQIVGDSLTVPVSQPKGVVDIEQDNKAAKNRHKLHWGLDTKERWERKSNM
ncbi:hypothetical protein ACJIZ3_014529 [Penstemon smallii]|uniref:Uncharacterized protein n=1 Tax=Penstemon smallii TaxID=265156 RepID=A0ABD3RN29_9LAMI